MPYGDGVAEGGSLYMADTISTVDSEWFGSSSLTQGAVAGSNNMYEGWLLECDEQTRNIHKKAVRAWPEKRNSGDMDSFQTESFALYCLLADQRGPAVGCMWAESVQELLKIRAKWTPYALRPFLVFENVRNVKVQETTYNGKFTTPIFGMHFARAVGIQSGTNILVSAQPSSPSTSTAFHKPPLALHGQTWCHHFVDASKA